MTDLDLTSWITKVLQHPGLQSMGHNQQPETRNLGLGWLYYALGRLVRPQRALVIGSYRGFVPLMIARALQDDRGPEGPSETGEVIFVDPSLVDDFWMRPDEVRAWFAGFGLANVRHHRMTTQEFVASPDYHGVAELGLLFVDGLHSAEQARFDHEAFQDRIGPRGMALFHDSMNRRESGMYGPERAYSMTVPDYIAALRREPALQVFDLPYGTGLTLVRRVPAAGDVPLLEGREAPPRPPHE